MDWLTVWLPTEAFGFYRPLTFVPLLLIRSLFGYYPAWLFHGLNVAQHALNGALLVTLSWRLWRRWRWALAAGLLFALFPFSYQAVAVYGHNVHPTTAGLLLLGLHAYLTAIQRGRVRWWILTGGLFLLGLLSHETAFLFGPLAALVHWNRTGRLPHLRRKHTVRSVPPWLVFSLLGLVYVGVYQLLPVSAEPPGVSPDNPLLPKLLYLLQSAVHPLAWFSHRLPDLSATSVVLGGVALALALTLWSARRPEHRLPLLLGWVWWGLAALVIAYPLPAGYLLHGPRLLYLGSVGLALLWPLLLEPLRQLPRVGRLAWAVALAFILLTGWGFVRGRLAQYGQLVGPVQVTQQVMRDRPSAEGVVLVNLPEWLAPLRNTYPVGSEHVAMLGPYLFLEELVEENLRASHPARAIKLPELLHDAGYPYGIFGETDLRQAIPADWAPAGSQVVVVGYTADGLRSLHAGGLAPAAEPAAPLAQLGPYTLLVAEAARCDGRVKLISDWSWPADQLPAPTVSLFAQLLDGAGQLVAQADGPPLGLRPDLIAPAAGWTITDRRALVPGGDGAKVLLGAYDYASGMRFPAVAADGSRLADDALAIAVSDCR